jgi:hypothetical protein
MALENELAKLSNLDDVSFDSAAVVNGENAKDIFCKDWASAKKVLTAAQTMIKNPIVKMIIGILINVGDGLQKNICPAPTTTTNTTTPPQN